MSERNLADSVSRAIREEGERRDLLEGRRYASPIEGYGDLTCALAEVEGFVKEIRKEHKGVPVLIRLAEQEELETRMGKLSLLAQTLTAYAVKLAATAERNRRSLAMMSGGNLFDMLEEQLDDNDNDDDESEETENG